MSDHDWLPLFPLDTVLFPGGALPLKVFETRYIDMVRDCMKRNAPFGVVRIKSGKEVGVAAQPDSVGCLAHIVEWDMPDLGLLMLQTSGGQRFRILETRVLPDQRIEARTELIADDADAPPSTELVACATALKTVIQDINAAARASGEVGFNPFPSELRLDSTCWVANRWCEILPISTLARQKLLELTDAQSRLAIVHQYLVQHGIVAGDKSH
ncbi:MAG: LON peptidase substrate-binding domain-containing protein [Burkholderiaceae bacterium]